jgi:hypothetical protein
MLSVRKITCTVALATLLTSVVSAAYEPAHAGTAADDLKQIEYRYYFRGRYQQAIESLQTFLARVDLAPADQTRAREVLAASYVLGGAPAMGKEVFTQLIVAHPDYPGPDPTVFKLEVVNTYAEARSDYMALAIKTAPHQESLAQNGASGDAALQPEGKPIYKKWWFYAGAAALLLVAGAAAGGSGGDNPASSTSTGTVVVGVRVQ